MHRLPRYLASGACRFAGSRSGNFATLTALTMPILFMFAAFAIDEGSLFLERRDLQAAADLAAIAAASDIDRAQAAATAVLTDNGAGPTDADVPAAEAEAAGSPAIRLSVETGAYAADPGVPAEARFAAGVAPANAARVRLVAAGTRYFAGALIPPPSIAVVATAARVPEATLSIGSRLARLDGGALNATLGALTGSTVSLSLMDYEALAAADISLLGTLDALRTDLDLEVATYGDLLKSKVGLGRFVAAIEHAGGLDTSASIALARLAHALTGADAAFPLAGLVDLGPYAERAPGTRAVGLEPVAGVLDLVSAAALLAIANGSHQIELGLDAATDLASASATLVVGEPPQGAALFGIGGPGAAARTAQLRLLVRLRIGGGALPAAVQLPIMVELAPAEARIAAISCPAGGADEPTVTVEARPGLARLSIGEPARLSDWTRTPTAIPARLLDAPLVKVTGDARADIASPDTTTLRFSASDIRRGIVRQVATDRMVGSLTGTLVSGLRLRASVAGLSLGLGDATKAALTAVLAQAAPAIDRVLDGLLATLGVRVGEADIRVTAATCGRAVLVQ